MEDNHRHRILVRGVNWIGDAVMTTPALSALSKARQNSALSLLVRPSVSALFDHDPHLDEILLYGAEFMGVAGKLRLASFLRKKAFDTAYLLQNAFDAALVSYLAKIPERIGYSRDGRGVLLTKPIPFRREDRKMHHVDYYLALLRAAGLNAEWTPPWLYLTIEERLAARERLSALRRPILGMNPGAAYGSAKRWLPERFADVARLFIQDTSGSIVIFGGRAETAIAQEIARTALRLRNSDPSLLPRATDTHVPLTDITSPVVNLAGTTPLRHLLALIAECDLLLTNDSGPMHISYAVGTPLVALFGSTDPSLTGPVGEGHEVIRSTLPCSPCFKRVCPEETLRCMHDITSGEVSSALRRILPRTRAVFFDRDGTLCRDAHYLSRWEDFEILPDIETLRVLKERGFALIGLTNQSGIARGIVPQRFVEEVNKVFVEEYGFTDFLYCPHGPQEHCACRKPETEMVARARGRYGLDLKRSYVVGDKDADMLLAQAVGAAGILVTTGQQQSSPYASVVVKSLGEAVRSILVREEAT